VRVPLHVVEDEDGAGTIREPSGGLLDGCREEGAVDVHLHRGRVVLDVDLDWDQVALLVEDAYRSVAPKRLAALL
jgi:hypothetical protein